MKQFSKELGKVSITPKGDWDSSITNEKLDIVYDRRNNQAYIAKQDVPIGVDIDNREYWQPLNVSGYADNNFINLTAENENGTITAYESLEEAVATIFPINRRVGATLSFYNLNSDRLDRQAEFELWQFNSTDLANWENKDYWNNIYYNWNVFAGWYIDDDALKNHVETPNVGQYAYVGSNLNDALLYQCRTNGTWTNTGIKVRNYISVVVKGNITIGENGNWFSDGEDTGIPSTPAVDEQLDNIITKHESLSRTVQGIAATGGASTATNVTYNNDSSGLNAENAQDAIDEIQSSKIDKTSILQESGGAEDKIMSQKAVTDNFTKEANRVNTELDKNSQDISNINKTVSGIIGFKNKPLDLVWKKGYTDLQGQKVLGGSWGVFISTTSILLDDYDKLSFTLTNVNSTLPAGQGVSILLTKEGESPIQKKYSETNIICSDYPGYTAHFNQKTKDAAPPIIYGTKNSILDGGSGEIEADEIVCVGDSLTNNYPTKLQKYAVGYSVKKCQMGSETSIANLCRMGGLQFVNAAPITIPASGATDPFPIAARWVTDLNKYSNLVFANIDQPSTTLNGAIVNGIKGSFKKVTSSAKGLVIFNSSDSVIKTFDTIADVELSTLSDVSYCKITINNPYTNEPHLSLDDEPQDVDSLCTQNGYIGSNGNFVSYESFKCSDKIMLTGKSRIYADGLAASEGYIFTRTNEGSEIKLGSYNIFTAGNYTKYKNSIHIIFTGQNGGYTNEEDLVAQIKTSVPHLKRYIVVSTWSTRTTEKLNKLMVAAFGNKYVNLREYMINQSVLDAIRLGLIDSGSNVNNWQSLFIADGTHPNDNGNTLWARLFWNTLLDLGFVKGERI